MVALSCSALGAGLCGGCWAFRSVLSGGGHWVFWLSGPLVARCLDQCSLGVTNTLHTHTYILLNITHCIHGNTYAWHTRKLGDKLWLLDHTYERFSEVVRSWSVLTGAVSQLLPGSVLPFSGFFFVRFSLCGLFASCYLAILLLSHCDCWVFYAVWSNIYISTINS